MKNTILSIFILTLTGCAMLPKSINYTDNVDLTKYSDENFFISFGSLTTANTPIQYLSIESYSGYVPKSKATTDDLYYSVTDPATKYFEYHFGNPANYTYKISTLQESFDKIITEAKNAGANALINITISNVVKITAGKTSQGYKITGLAVKK